MQNQLQKNTKKTKIIYLYQMLAHLIHNCVIPNLDLINNETLYLIKEIHNDCTKIFEQRNDNHLNYSVL